MPCERKLQMTMKCECGRWFICTKDASCWCATEKFPIFPLEDDDCICRECLLTEIERHRDPAYEGRSKRCYSSTGKD